MKHYDTASRTWKIRTSALILLLLIFITTSGGLALAGEFSLAPLNPRFLEWRDNANSSTDSDTTRTASPQDAHPMGYHPGPLDLSYLRDLPQVDLSGRRAIPLPSRYDLRDEGLLSAVRNQSPYGTCWTHSAMAAIESNRIKRDLANTAIDLAERYLAWFGYNDIRQDGTILPGFTRHSLYQGHPTYDQGGDDWKAIAILSRWTGPASEDSAPYPDPHDPLASSDPDGSESVVLHLRDALYLNLMDRTADGVYPALNRNLAKRALMAYGALSIGMNYKDDCWNSDTDGFYNSTAPAGSANHAVTLVGWDDDYSASNFNTAPPEDGAWIVRNSWGTNWGDGGYLYISYCDSALDSGVTYLTDDTANYDDIYQYDPMGWCVNYDTKQDEVYFANVFNCSGENQSLAAVAFYTSVPDVKYTVSIYNSVNGAPTDGDIVYLSDEGTLAAPGYHTVPLTEIVPLTKGKKFSVVVNLSAEGDNLPIPIEMAIDDYSDMAMASAGQSYVSLNGAEWIDTTSLVPSANVCVKAFTLDDMISITVTKSTVTSESTEILRATSGTEKAITITPLEGYAIDTVKLDGNYLDTTDDSRCSLSGGILPLTLTASDMQASHTLEANFLRTASRTAPTNLDPENKSTKISLTPTLKAATPSEDAEHIQTQWQIASGDSFTSPLLDTETFSDLTALAVPNLLLEGGKTYSWRVRYLFDDDSASGWATADFSTSESVTEWIEIEGSGARVPTAQYVNPATVDTQAEAAVESQQAGSNAVMGVSTPGKTQLKALRAVSTEDLPSTGLPDGTKLPHGVLSFSLVPEDNGFARITVHFSKPLSEGAKWWKYNSVSKTWQEYPHAVFSSDGKSATLTFEDGEEWDDDGTANGLIVDPSGPDGSVRKTGSLSLGGGGCSAAPFAPAMLLLLAPIMLLRRR